MRLYSRTGAVAVTDAGEHYEAGPDGAFDFPEELGARLVNFATAGKPQWETDVGRQHRLIAEELERRKDPATLLDAVNKLVAAAQAVAPAPQPAVAPQHAPPPAPVRSPVPPAPPAPLVSGAVPGHLAGGSAPLPAAKAVPEAAAKS